MRIYKKETQIILDNKYLILKTIGDGRYARYDQSSKHLYRVKLAVNLNNNKHVAIKFLKVHNSGISKHKALECLLKEISILTECEH